MQTADSLHTYPDPLCHTDIWPINELTGKNYTSSVFIPGSLIVLNIESDFNKWIGMHRYVPMYEKGSYITN